jgi:hypothetical protein
MKISAVDYIKLLYRNVLLIALIELCLAGIFVSILYFIGVILSHLTTQRLAIITVHIKGSSRFRVGKNSVLGAVTSC